MNISLKNDLLHTVYEVYESFVHSFSFACRKGCSSCCTQSVNCTELEAGEIVRYVEKKNAGKVRLLVGKLARDSSTSPVMTTNQFAHLCIQGEQSIPEEEAWSLVPCVFLQDNCCSIYPFRPFVCRSFASTVCCESEGSAQLPAAFISLNSTVMQIIEHIDQGNTWGNMNSVLCEMLARKQSIGHGEAVQGDSGNLHSQPCPGFLIPPEDEEFVSSFISVLYDTDVHGRSFEKWISAK